MRIVFMGTPDFAVPTLEALCEAGHEILLVITQPDKSKDRGKKVKPGPVKEAALARGLSVAQPEKVKGNPELVRQLRELAPDAIVVVAYGKILPKEILDIPPLGCINVHGSLLPRFRGAAPVQWAVIEGDEFTGITIMYMEEGMDTGDMLSKAKTPTAGKTAGELSDELSRMGAELLVKTLKDLEEGTVVPEPQDDSLATYAPMIFKKDGLLDFTKPAAVLERRCLGLYPWPGTYTYLAGDLFKVWQCRAEEGETKEVPGTILSASDEGILVAAGEGILRLLEVQIPGKRRMACGDFLRGKKIETGTRLG